MAGKGIEGGQVVGSTDNDEFMLEPVDPVTGASLDEDSGGVVIRPTDIHATALTAMGLSYESSVESEPRGDQQDPLLMPGCFLRAGLAGILLP